MRTWDKGIIENLVSRTVTPYEYALNIARLVQINQKNLDFVLDKTASPLFTQLAERLKISTRHAHTREG